MTSLEVGKESKEALNINNKFNKFTEFDINMSQFYFHIQQLRYIFKARKTIYKL